MEAPDLPDSLPIPGYPEYRVVRDGTTWKLIGTGRRPKQWKRLKPQWVGGSLHIVVGPKGNRKTHRVARLVLSLFVEPRPLGFHPVHFPDPDPANCHADNLRWAPLGATWAGEQTRTKNLPKRSPGSSHHNSRLSPEQVAEARRLYREEQWNATDIAGELGCSQKTVFDLLKGKTYADVPDPLGPIQIRKQGREGGFNGAAILTDEEREQALAWRERDGLSYPEIGRRLGVSTTTIWRLVQKRKRNESQV